jgi:hypothetical protein
MTHYDFEIIIYIMSLFFIILIIYCRKQRTALLQHLLFDE